MSVYTDREITHYTSIYLYARPDLEGMITGVNGGQILQKSNLPRDVLHKIWEIADSDKTGILTKEQFFVALRLVALAQEGNTELDQASVKKIPSVLPSINIERPKDLISLDISADQETLARKQRQNMEIAKLSMDLQKLGIQGISETPGGATGGFAGGYFEWIKPGELVQFKQLFVRSLSSESAQFMKGYQAKQIFLQSKLPSYVLAAVWELCDVGKDGQLNEPEFVAAMCMISRIKEFGAEILPHYLPDELVSLILPNKRDNSDSSYASPEDTGKLLLEVNALKEEVAKLEAEQVKLTDELEHLQETRDATDVHKIAKLRDYEELCKTKTDLQQAVAQTQEEIAEYEQIIKDQEYHVEQIEQEIQQLHTQRLRNQRDNEIASQQNLAKSRQSMQSQNLASDIERRATQTEWSKNDQLERGKELAMKKSAWTPQSVSEARLAGNSWVSQIGKTDAPLPGKRISLPSTSILNDAAK
jgi:Cytoskeletal-regulatory complex EF hand